MRTATAGEGSSGRTAARRASQAAGPSATSAPLERARGAGEAVERRGRPRPGPTRPSSTRTGRARSSPRSGAERWRAGRAASPRGRAPRASSASRLRSGRPGTSAATWGSGHGDDHPRRVEVAGVRPHHAVLDRAHRACGAARDAPSRRASASASPWLPPASRWLGSGANAATCSSTLASSRSAPCAEEISTRASTASATAPAARARPRRPATERPPPAAAARASAAPAACRSPPRRRARRAARARSSSCRCRRAPAPARAASRRSSS